MFYESNYVRPPPGTRQFFSHQRNGKFARFLFVVFSVQITAVMCVWNFFGWLLLDD